MRKLASACVTAAAMACNLPGAVAQQPSVRPVAFEYDAYYRQGDQDYTSNLVSTELATPGPTSCGDCCADPGCCDDVACGSGCGGGLFSGSTLVGDHIEGLSLAGLIGLCPDSALEVGGWTEGVYMDNNVPLSQAYNDLLSFDDVPDHFHVGQQWFYLGRAADGACGLDYGFRIDAFYGTDAQKSQSFGNPFAGIRNQGAFDASWDHGEYGWAMPQLYGEIAAGDWSTKIGHFFTPLGYEVIPVTGNFFRSHSYTMFNSEPFTHTGALATYTGFENLTLYGGWSAGWDTGFDQLNQGNTLISGFSSELTDDITFTYLNTYGNFGWRDGGDDNSYSHAIVMTVGLTDNLQYIAQSDLVRTDNPGVSQFDTIGLNQYLIYKINDVVSAGGRAEWWKADGVSFNEVTGGFNIKLLDNVLLRPEFRHDWAPGVGIDEDTFLCDVILTY